VCPFPLYYLNSITDRITSRRGAPVSGDMDVILFHPTHVHVPTPNISHSSAFSNRNITGRTPLSSKSGSRMTKAEQETSPLIKGVVEPLTQEGLIAATLSTGARKWQGVVRLPEKDKDGQWELMGERVKSVKADKGFFRRMDLK